MFQAIGWNGCVKRKSAAGNTQDSRLVVAVAAHHWLYATASGALGTGSPHFEHGPSKYAEAIAGKAFVCTNCNQCSLALG